MMLFQALRYPFRGNDWFRRMLTLTFLQLLPVFSQLILLGYGFEMVRAVYAGQTDLPPIRWLPTLGDGFRFLLAGLFYLFPILLIIAVVVGTNKIGSTKSLSNIGVFGILLAIGVPLLLFLIRIVSVRRNNISSDQRQHKEGSGMRVFLSGVLPLFITILAILLFRALLSRSGIETMKPNGLSILLFATLTLLLFLIDIALHIGGVRYAIENKGLFAATTNAKLLLKKRIFTGMLFLNVFLLTAISILAIAVGLVLFILPGLFLFVTCSLAFWYMFACYGKRVGIHKADLNLTTKTTTNV